MTTFPTTGPVAATIDISAGDITVSASDRTDCVVHIQPRDEAKPTDVQAAANATVEFVNGTLVVQTTKPWRRFTGPNMKDGSVNVRVELPSNSTLRAQSGVGFVHCEGELADTTATTGVGALRLDRVGGLRAKTGLGDIDVTGIAGDADVSTGTGAVRLGAVTGSLKVRNANGSVAVAECERDLHVRTSSGSITVDRALASVSAGSAAGDIRIMEISTGSVAVRTGAGAIELGVREGAAAWVQASSKYGSVRNGLTVSAGPAESESAVEVRAATGLGDITITRAHAA